MEATFRYYYYHSKILIDRFKACPSIHSGVELNFKPLNLLFGIHRCAEMAIILNIP